MNIYLSIIYLIATITFIYGLKLLGHPETAKKGNLIAGAVSKQLNFKPSHSSSTGAD